MEQVAILQTFPCSLEKQRRLVGNRQSALHFMLRQRISLARWLNRGNRSGGPDPAHTRQLEQATTELNEVTALYNLAVSVGSTLKLEEVLHKLYQESSLLIDTTNFAFILYDREAATLNFELVVDRGQSLKPRPVKFAQSHGLVRRVLTERTPVLVEDLSNDHPARIDQTEGTMPVQSWLGVPIFNPTLAGEAVQGMIAIWSPEPQAFTDHDVWLLAAIGTQAALAIRNARVYEASQRQAAENARLHQTVLAERDRVIAAQEQARKALAGELHDGPTQLVSAITMHLDFCRMLLERDPSRLAEELTTTRDLAQRAVHQIRTLLFELRPLALETRGLVAALTVFVERRQAEILDQTKLTLELKTGGPDNELLWRDKKVETALFAIVQETVNNALKHAAASEIRVQLQETEDAVQVTISDNGRGFDVETVLTDYDRCGSLGMLNLHERADLIGADLTLVSAPGRGTKVTVNVPKSQRVRLKKRGATGPLQAREQDG